MKIDTSKLHQAEKFIHEWTVEYQLYVSELVLNEAVKAECACAETAAFVRAGL